VRRDTIQLPFSCSDREKLKSWALSENYNQWLSLLPKDREKLTLDPHTIEINFCTDPSKLGNQKAIALAEAASSRFYPLSNSHHNFSVNVKT
jgi:hypothetical protein